MQRRAAQGVTTWMPRTLAVAGLCLVIALLLYVPATVPTITTRYGGVDGGELAATAVSGGVPHPSGYPTYMLLARAALRIFPGEPAGQLADLSAVSGALAVALTAVLATIAFMPGSSTRPSLDDLLAGAYAALVLAVGRRFWSQAIIPEVYATSMFWLSLSALLGVMWLRWHRAGFLWVAAFCLGIGTGAHLTILALGPAALVAGFTPPRRQHRRMPRRVLLGVGLAFLCGAAIYGLLPLWAMRDTVPTWGDQRTLAGLWAHISGAEYRYLAGIVPWSQRVGRLSFAARDLLVQPGWIGLSLAAFLGIAYGWEHNRPFMLATATLAFTSLLFAISYGGTDGTVYLLPWTWVWSIWAGFGVKAGLELVRRSSPAPLATAAAAAVLLGTLAWTVIQQRLELDLHTDTSAREDAIAVLRDLPETALFVTNDDAQTFGAWYVQYTLGVRPDVLVVDRRLLARDWYRAQLRHALQVTDDASLCAALAAGNRPAHLPTGASGASASDVLQQACIRWER